MDFIKSIIYYYNAEARQGLVLGFSVGFIMLALSVLALFLGPASSLIKGIATVMLLGGLIGVFGGYFAGKSAQKSRDPKVELYSTDPKGFIDQEYKKVESTHKAWVPIRIFWSLFLLLGVILLLTVTTNFWVGIAIGALILGTVGHIEEAISYQHNEKYRKEVQIERKRIQQETTFLNFKF